MDRTWNVRLTSESGIVVFVDLFISLGFKPVKALSNTLCACSPKCLITNPCNTSAEIFGRSVLFNASTGSISVRYLAAFDI